MEDYVTVDSVAACGTMEEHEPLETSLSGSSKNNVLRSNRCEEVPSRWSKKFSAGRSHKPLAVMFRLAVMLILFVVMVSKLNVL